MAPSPLVALFESGRSVGLAPRSQLEALAAARGHGLVDCPGGVRLGGAAGGSTLPREVVSRYPAPVATCYAAMLCETHPVSRVHRLKDTFEVTVELAACVLIQDALAAGERPESLGREILRRLPRPLTSAWPALIGAAQAALRGHAEASCIPRLVQAEIESPAALLLQFRNRLAHSLVPSDDIATAWFVESLPALHDLLQALAPLAQASLVEVGPGRARALMGIEPGPWGAVPIPEGIPAGHLACVGARALDLHPLLLTDGTMPAAGALSLLLYAGLGPARVDFSAAARGAHVSFPELFDEFVRRYVPGWTHRLRGRRGSLSVEDLALAYGKYELLGLVSEGSLRLETLLTALSSSEPTDVGLGAAIASATLDEARALVDEARRLVRPAAVGSLPLSLGASRPVRPLPTSNRQRPGWVVGRDALASEVLAAVRDGGLVTLVALGGMGKTTLARLVGERAASEGVSVYELSLASLDTVFGLMASLARLFAEGDTTLPGVGEPVALARALAEYLDGRAALLILDNAESLVGRDPVGLRTLLDALVSAPGAPDLCVTSRQSTGARGERVVEVPPLTRADSLALVLHLAPGVVDERAGDITSAAAGHPLALEVLVASDGVVTPGEALAASLARSWDLLPPESHALMACLAAGAPDLGDWLARELVGDDSVRRLSGHGLLKLLAGRWSAHPVVLEFARPRLREAAGGELQRAWGREIERQEATFRQGSERDVIAWMRAEREAFAAGLRAAIGAAPEAIASTLVAAESVLLWSGSADVALAGVALVRREALESEALEALDALEAVAAYFAGEHARGEAAARRALTAKDADLALRARYLLSVTRRAQGDLETAEAEMRRVREGAAAQCNWSILGNAGKELGVIATALGRPVEALAHFDDAEAAYACTARRVAAGFATQCSSVAARHTGNHREAEVRATRALAEGCALGEVRLQAYAHLDLAEVNLDLGRWVASREHLDDAEACFVAARHHAMLHRVELARARLERLGGDPGRAWRRCVRVGPLADPEFATRVALEQASIAWVAGRRRTAERLIREVPTSGLRPRMAARLHTVAHLVGVGDAGTDGGRQVAARWQELGDPWHARRALLRSNPAAAVVETLLDDAVHASDVRFQSRVFAWMARSAGDESGPAWAEAAASAARVVGSAAERAEAADVVAQYSNDDEVVREAARLWFSLGAGPRAGTCLARLARPAPSEAEMAAFFTADSPTALRRPWNAPALVAATTQHAGLLSLARPPRPLLDRLAAEPEPEPGENELESLARVHVAQVLLVPRVS